MAPTQILTDSYGLPITTTSREALDWYNRGIQALLGFRADGTECFHKALALAPQFSIARSHLGMCYFLEETAECANQAKECFAKAASEVLHLTDRERDVVETVNLWGQGKGREALERMQKAVTARPREVTLIQRLYFVYFMQGLSEKMRDLIATVLPHYENDSYVLGMYSFSLEETRDFARAFEYGNKARALNPADAWSLHALAHAHYETGAFAAGTHLMSEGLPQCEGVGFFRVHLVWHHALFLWEQGRNRQTLALYRELFPNAEPMLPPNFVDAITLLWRLNLSGTPTPQEWEAIVPSLEQLRTLPTYLFNQMHIVLGLAGAHQTDWAQVYLDELRARVKPDRPGILGEVGVPLAEGIIAYSKGDYARTVDCLLPIKQRIINVGGSHAQREVFIDLLADACLRSGAYRDAVTILEEKRQQRLDRPLALASLEKAYRGLGESGKAEAAKTQSHQLWQRMGADASVLNQTM